MIDGLVEGEHVHAFNHMQMRNGSKSRNSDAPSSYIKRSVNSIRSRVR